MPNAPLRMCNEVGCPNKVLKGYCERHRKDRYKQHNAERDKEAQKDYQSRRWREASERFRKENPLCCMCEEEDIVTPSEVTDHKIPIADGGSFWDKKNWQALCRSCHNRKTREELNRRR